jgi:hypothetical protein
MLQAEGFFEKGEYEAALQSLSEITGSGGALLLWSDQDKLVAIRARQGACCLAQAYHSYNSSLRPHTLVC